MRDEFAAGFPVCGYSVRLDVAVLNRRDRVDVLYDVVGFYKANVDVTVSGVINAVNVSTPLG
jgi:HSP20 family molecular chaperone IbpA